MGRSQLISITSTTSPCRTSCNMTKALIFVLLGLVAMALSENLGEDQGNEIEETLDEIELENLLQENEDESLDASRMKRDADPRKKKKHKGKKPRKAGRKENRTQKYKEGRTKKQRKRKERR